MIEDKTVHKLLKKAKRTFRRFTPPESVPCYTIFWFWQNSSPDYFVNIIDKQQGSQTDLGYVPCRCCGLKELQNNKALKRLVFLPCWSCCLRELQNNKALKPADALKSFQLV